MTDDITQQPLARALLAKLAQTRGKDDPLGSLARVVLNGETTLRGGAGHSWHGQALSEAFAESLDKQRRLAPEARAEIERQAQQLREAGESVDAYPDDLGRDRKSSPRDGGATR